MSNNVQTAADFSQVKQEAQAQINEITAKQPELDAAAAAAKAEYDKLKKAANSSNFAQDADGKIIDIGAFNEAREAASFYKRTILDPKVNAAANTFGQIVNLKETINYADSQIAIAQAGPPNNNSNTQPAGGSTNANSVGNNTTVPPAAPAVPVQADPELVTGTGVVTDPVLPQPQLAVTTLSPGIDNPAGSALQADSVVTLQKQAEQKAAEEDPEGAAVLASVDVAVQKQAELDPEGAVGVASIVELQKQIDPEGATGVASVADAQRSEIEFGATFAEQDALRGAINNAREQAITQDVINFNQIPDWRVRLSLAPSATYLYKASDPGILKPLQATRGVIFPYTPSIQMGYTAAYDAFDVTHSNYKIYQYKSSSVEQISITAEFTAQDATEAAYMLAVIHFFRSVTKMFYGKDQNPIAGTPPPLCYLYGLGDFQFNQHPLLINNFSYTLPTDVDYIRAGAPTLQAGQSSAGYNTPNNSLNPATARMQTNNLPAGAGQAAPNWTTQTNIEPTYVPTKLQLTITAFPIITRKDISNNFSVKDYATGALLRGRQNSNGGIW